MMRTGFTGTRNGATEEQKFAIEYFLQTLQASELHHGDCVGADADAHWIAKRLGIKVVIHPPKLEGYRAFCEGAAQIHEPLPYLERNRRIVDETYLLLACPKEHTMILRSGTWSTVRYARKTGKRVIVIYPDGRYE